MSLTVIHDGLGRDSRTIACLLAERRLLLDGELVGPEAVHAAVFADTGAEWPHTYAALAERLSLSGREASAARARLAAQLAGVTLPRGEDLDGEQLELEVSA